MPVDTVDALQRQLTNNVFGYATDSKKAAGRALGTLVEVVTFYLLKSWGFENSLAIERKLPEYGNPDITHNVEFSLHPSQPYASIWSTEKDIPLTTAKIKRWLKSSGWSADGFKDHDVLSSRRVLRNSSTIHETHNRFITAHLDTSVREPLRFSIHRHHPHPFALVECKRVGVEEGNKRGPQTIEKAKQGAYVARTVSSVQKIRMPNGETYGVMPSRDGKLRYKPYSEMLSDVINSMDNTLLRDFTLTVGIVSNHGNWFTENDQNKELKVLSQSYDWLLFLTDAGLLKFVRTLIINPIKKYQLVKCAFEKSYGKHIATTGRTRRINRFTKVTMDLPSHFALQEYFEENKNDVESWFNVIGPNNASISDLKTALATLASKPWEGFEP